MVGGPGPPQQVGAHLTGLIGPPEPVEVAQEGAQGLHPLLGGVRQACQEGGQGPLGHQQAVDPRRVQVAGQGRAQGGRDLDHTDLEDPGQVVQQAGAHLPLLLAEPAPGRPAALPAAPPPTGRLPGTGLAQRDRPRPGPTGLAGLAGLVGLAGLGEREQQGHDGAVGAGGRQEAVAGDLPGLTDHLRLRHPHRGAPQTHHLPQLRGVGQEGVHTTPDPGGQGVHRGRLEGRVDPHPRTTSPTHRARSRGERTATRIPAAASCRAVPTL